ncbi:hypothetical protein ACWEPM_33705 [Streptomyces sp. NPDC004244]
MASRRKIDEGTAGGQLAVFLVDLTRNTSVRDLSKQFGYSSSSWGNYLNGSQLIPKQLVGQLVQSFTAAGPVRQTRAVQALKLWNAAEAERRGGSGRELVRQHQRRDDALHQVAKYRGLAENAEKHLAELRPMLVFTENKLETTELRLRLASERECARLERQLGQAREWLVRVQLQQERARGRRMTAEEQQAFWMAEVLAAQDQIDRLQREVRNIKAVLPDAAEPGRDEAPDTDDFSFASDFDARLEHITAEGLADEALIREDLAREDDLGTDKPLQLPAGQDLVQHVQAAGLRAWRWFSGVLAWVVMPGIACFMYLLCQSLAEGTDKPYLGVFMATLLGFPALIPLINSFGVSRRWTLGGAIVLHVAWSTLLILDGIPWTAPQ